MMVKKARGNFFTFRHRCRRIAFLYSVKLPVLSLIGYIEEVSENRLGDLYLLSFSGKSQRGFSEDRVKRLFSVLAGDEDHGTAFCFFGMNVDLHWEWYNVGKSQEGGR